MILKGNMEADETGWGNTFLAIFILELPMVSNRFCGIFQITDFASWLSWCQSLLHGKKLLKYAEILFNSILDMEHQS